jgi:hypothetical protein
MNTGFNETFAGFGETFLAASRFLTISSRLGGAKIGSTTPKMGTFSLLGSKGCAQAYE